MILLSSISARNKFTPSSSLWPEGMSPITCPWIIHIGSVKSSLVQVSCIVTAAGSMIPDEVTPNKYKYMMMMTLRHIKKQSSTLSI